jgi:hypothetical protein
MPMVSGVIYSQCDCPTMPAKVKHMKNVPYHEAIGSLMYASITTQPDITFAMLTLSQFLENPGELHWTTVKWSFRYLSGTRDLELTYSGEHHNLVRYMDADSAAQEHWHTISGHIFILNMGVVSWSF